MDKEIFGKESDFFGITFSTIEVGVGVCLNTFPGEGKNGKNGYLFTIDLLFIHLCFYF